MNFGGIVGMSQGHIVQINSCATTARSRLEVAADSVGGICGNFIGLGDQSLISNCNNAAPVKGYGYVGGIVGLVTNAVLVNNHNTGNVWSAWDATFGSQSSRPSGYYAGGIAGAVVGESSLFECYNSGTVAADSNYVGGIAGALMGESNFFSCINYGDVSGFNQVGGLAGLILKDAWFEWSSNNGLVRGIAQVGGLVGYLKSSTGNRCSDNHNYADTIHFSAMGGGVCGYAEDTTMLEGCSSVMILPYDTIIRINSEGALTQIRYDVNNGNSYEGIVIVLDCNLNFNDWAPIGTPKHPFRGTFDGQDHTINFGINNDSTDYQGFFGYMQGTVKNVNFSQCSVIGHNYVGVIAGYCHGTISNCYSYGEKVEGEKYVGGLVGMASYSEIQDCFNGDTIVGEQYVGGIVGDFASCKNDNCYGTMKYDLYGGNVSRCYNYGMVRATGDTSHVGGIAGFTSAEVKHCYNSGIVDGKDFVGGLCGQLDGDNLHHCYNAGHVSATGNKKGAVCGSLDLQNIIYNCFYDRQMCTVQDNNASGYNTLKMTGTALQNVFGTDYWSYHDNEYPTLKTTKKDSTYFRISVKPLLLPGNMPVDKVVQPFCGVTGNAPDSHVEWSRYRTATEAVDTIIHLADKDSITLLGCGVDTLKVSHPGYGIERLVPIVVAAKEATVETVHTCGNSYTWHGQPYNETGFYTCDTCANKPALDLTITPVTITPTLINSTCETIPDGAVLVSVTGGPGNGFRYTWYNSSYDSIGNTPALTDIPAGSYSVTVTDSLYSTCSQTSPITLTAVAPVALTIAGCSESKPYDGTALTGSRFVVTEEGHLPDTIAANKFALLSNGDTLRVTLISDTLINMATSEDGVIIDTLTISYKGIDHSCHYDVTLMAGMLKVTPRPVVIIVNDASKEVGDPDPEFTGSVPGLINPNDLGTISYSRINNTEKVGNYPDVLTATYTENPNYSVSINMGDFVINCHRFTTKISNWPSMEITGQDECFSAANTNALPSAEQIQAMIVNSNNLQAVDFTIAFKDTALKSSTCDWQWARIYTISTTDTDYYCDVESRALYVSGGDQSDPVRSNAWPWDSAGIPYQNACLGSFNMDLYLPKDTDLFVDCSQLFITHSDVSWGDDRDGWTIQRSYVVSDSCGHTIYDTIRVSGSDRTPPVATNPNVKNNTLWADYVQCLCDSIHVINDIVPLKTLFGLSDECTGNDISLVSKTKTLKTGDHCADTVVVAYTVADPYGNSTTIYHAQFIQDTTRPTFDIVPKDIALCLLDTGKYHETVNSVIYDEHNQVINRVANIHDNCTKLQGSFVVHDSIDLDNYTVVNGIRQYEQYWTVTDSCGNVDTNKMIIKVNPLPTIRIDTLGTQTITYGEQFQDITINNEYSVVSLTPSDRGLVYSEGKVTGWLDSAGTYSYTATATSNLTPNCGSVDTVITIDVNPRPITIAAGSATKKYDGTPLTSPYYECTVIDYDNMQVWVPILNVDSIASLTITGSQTDVGSSANVPSNAVITRRTDATVNMNSSYAVSYANGTLTVTTNDTLITVVPGSGSKEYDGTPLTKNAHSDFKVTGVPEGLTWEATADGIVWNVMPGEGEKAVNAVTSFQIFDSVGNDVTSYFTNIKKDSTGTLTITQKPLTITAGSDSIVYDGTALTKNSYTHTDLVAGETITSVTITGSQTLAGTSDNVPSDAVIKNGTLGDVTSNYNITYVNGTLKVTQKPLTITAGSDTIIYNGYWLTNNTYTHSALAAGDSLWSVTITGRALYGESNNVPSDAVIKNTTGDTVTNNYNITYENGHLKINQKKLTIRSGDSSKTYDGTALTCHTFIDTGLVRNDYIESVEMPSNLTWADTIDNVISLPCIKNPDIHDTIVTNCYEIKYVYGKLMVAKKDLTITAGSATKIYNGTELTKDSYTHTELLPGDSIWSVSIEGSQTVAGTSDNVPCCAEIQNSTPDRVTDNYDITYVNGTLTVTKKPITITADGATKEYDGTTLTKNTYTHTALIEGDSIWSVTMTGSQTLVGSSNNVPSAAVIKNDTNENVTASYAITYKSDTLKVTPNTSKIVVKPGGGSKTYDGTPLTKTADTNFTVTGVPTGFTWTAKADGTVTNVIPGAGEKPVNAVSDFQILNAEGDTVTNQFSNIDASATRMLTISPKNVTLASGGKTREYNGTPLTNAEVEDTNANGLLVEDGWADGEGATYQFTGSQTLVGKDTNSFSYTLNSNTLASNYNIIKTEDTLEITVNTAAIAITSADGSWMYDGSTHTKPEFTVTYNGTDINAASGSNGLKFKLPTGDTLTVTPTFGGVKNFSDNIPDNNVFTYAIEHQDQYKAANITATYGTLAITANTDPIVITSADSSWMYDGSTHTKPEYTVTYNGTDINAASGSNGLKFKLPTGDTLTVTPTFGGVKNFSDNIPNNNVFTYAIEHQDQYTAANITATYGTLAITANTDTIVITSADGSWMYDGSTHTKPEYTVTYNSTDINAASGSNGLKFKLPTGDTLTVIPTFGGVTNFSDNVAHNNVFTYAIEHQNQYTAANIKSTYGTLAITANTDTIVITSADGSWMYNGSAQTKPEYTVTYNSTDINAASGSNGLKFKLPTGDTLTVNPTFGGIKNFSDNAAHNNVFTYAIEHQSQYTASNIKSTYGTLAITKRDVTLTSNDDSKEYDGTALTNTAVTESGSGFVSGEVSNIRATGTIIEVGSVTNSIVFDAATGYAATNYAITKNEGLLAITPSTKELKVVSANGNWTYDGNAHTKHEYTVTYGTESYNVVMAATATTGTATLSTGDTVTITPAASATITHVAQGDVANAFSFTVKHGDQYSNKTKAEGVLTITPKAVNITVNDASKTYGQGDPTFTGSVEGLLNDNDLGIVEYIRTNSDEEVGTYENVLSATFTTNSNYTVTIDSGNFTINCRNIVEPASWPENITGQNSCFADADTTGLKDAVEIRTLFANCNPVMNESDVTVSAQDDPTKTNDCDWTWTRTYTVSITGGCASVTKTMSVSGGNHRNPSFKVLSASPICPNEDGTYNVNPDITGNVSNVFDYCHSTAPLSIEYSDSEAELMSDGSRRIIRTWTVTDACGNDSVQTQVITINPAVEISVTPELQTIVLEDPITPITVTSQYSQYITSAISLNNVATTFDAAGLAILETVQGLEVSGTPADTGTYKLLFTAISDQFPVCYPKQAEATVIVRLMQDTVKVISGSASKPYDGTPLTSHNYVVTLGNDTIPADEGSNGLIFSVHFHDKLVITPVSSLTNAGTIDNEFTCVLDHPEHYKGLKKEFGTLTVNRASLSMSLDTARVYNGHPFVVTADQLHVTGLAETDTITGGTITTDGHIAGTYVCEEGGFNAFLENGVAIKSDFAINNGLGNYVPDFDVTLTIDPVTEGFACPADLLIVLTEGTADTMLVLTDSATLTPMVDNIVIGSNLDGQNPLTAGTHTLVWTLADDLGNVMTSCEQTVTVEYSPCEGVTYHGHFYDAKRIGYQCWMTENLRNETDAEGHPIANRHAYKEDTTYVEKFGYLYSWYSAMNVPEGDDTAIPADSIGDDGQPYVQGICPDGWAVGDHQDFSVLFDTVNNTTLLKVVGDGYWLPEFGGTLPNSGFNARANGLFNSAAQRFEDLLTGAHFWMPETGTADGTAASAVLQYYCSDGLFQQNPKGDLKGVRCIRKVAP